MREGEPTGRVLHKEITVSSPIDRVWWAWTTSEGMASWWAKKSWIELRVGGPWELYFLTDQPRGHQGSEGCRILSYCPPEMLSFSWNFPPSLPENPVGIPLGRAEVRPREPERDPGDSGPPRMEEGAGLGEGLEVFR